MDMPPVIRLAQWGATIVFTSNSETPMQHLDPVLTARRSLWLALASMCAIILIGFVYLFKPEVWLLKNLALYVTIHSQSASTSSAALSGRYHWQDLTQEEAIGVVRQFLHRPSLQLRANPSSSPVLLGPERYSGERFTPAYSLTDGEQTYFVSQRCATCFEYWAREGSSDHAPRNKSSLLNHAKTETIGLRFVQEHYPHPESLRTISQGDECVGPTAYTYTLYLREVAPDGTWGPGECNIEVDRVNGQVIGYEQQYFPILVSTRPAITLAAAERRVMNLLIIPLPISPKPTLHARLEVGEPDEQGREHLYYRINVVGTGVKGLNYRAAYSADIDARDGSLYRWYCYG